MGKILAFRRKLEVLPIFYEEGKSFLISSDYAKKSPPFEFTAVMYLKKWSNYTVGAAIEVYFPSASTIIICSTQELISFLGVKVKDLKQLKEDYINKIKG